jgi:hypothetical protein
MRTMTLGLLAILAFGCGGSDSTGPNSTANVAGTWTASLSNMSGSGVSCSSTSATTLTLTQSNTTFSGGYSGGELTCSGPGGTFSSFVGNGTILNGQVNGNSVSFDLDTPDFHHTGTVSGNSISGSATWLIDFGAPTGEVTLSGSWGAAR